jgi:phosphate acetyltransferase
MSKAIFIAATEMDVGKTTTCLGLVSGLKKRFKNIGFLKPVGQQTVTSFGGKQVDKDVSLFKHQFSLPLTEELMSPVTFPRGFTRSYLDGEVVHDDLIKKIKASFEEISSKSDFTIVEGTGHSAVGSIADLSNAYVAATLGLDVILVVPGGIGNAFDLLSLNKVFFESHGVNIRGVILNKVRRDKIEMVQEYFSKALKKLDIPLIGCVPYSDFLSAFSLQDLSKLLDAPFISGTSYSLRHFKHQRIVTISRTSYLKTICPNQLVITSSTREDIIEATIQLHKKYSKETNGKDLEGGLLLTGKKPPSKRICQLLEKAHLPAIHTRLSNYLAAKELASVSVKINHEDACKVQRAIDLMEKHIDFSCLGITKEKDLL